MLIGPEFRLFSVEWVFNAWSIVVMVVYPVDVQESARAIAVAHLVRQWAKWWKRGWPMRSSKALHPSWVFALLDVENMKPYILTSPDL